MCYGRPRRVKRPSVHRHVYHFLLPDDGIATYRDEAAKELEAANFEHIKAWHNTFFWPLAGLQQD